MESSNQALISLISEKDIYASRLIDILSTHGCDPRLNSCTLSENAGMCRMQLYRKLKKIWNKTPSRFIRDYRLAKACELLKKTDLKIVDVAYSVGFSSPSYFIKCFHTQYSCTPSIFRKKWEKYKMLHS